jgi:hypothetical protein
MVKEEKGHISGGGGRGDSDQMIGGVYCTVGGRTALDIATTVCRNAAAKIAVGACAADGRVSSHLTRRRESSRSMRATRTPCGITGARAVRRALLVESADNIAHHASAVHLPEDLFAARTQNLAGGKLQPPLAGVFHELVSHVEVRGILHYRQLSSHAECVYRRAGIHKL